MYECLPQQDPAHEANVNRLNHDVSEEDLVVLLPDAVVDPGTVVVVHVNAVVAQVAVATARRTEDPTLEAEESGFEGPQEVDEVVIVDPSYELLRWLLQILVLDSPFYFLVLVVVTLELVFTTTRV